MDKFLGRDEILSIEDLQFEDVDVPEWGGKVRVAELSSDTLLAFSDRQDGTKNNHMAELLSLALVDEEFKPLFNQADLDALGKKNGRIINKLAGIATRLNGISKTGRASAKKN